MNQFLSGDPREPFVSWMRNWPKERFIRYTSFGNSNAILVTQLDAFKEIFQTKANAFVKPEFNKRMITPITGVGMVFTEGEESRSQRKLLSREYLYLRDLPPIVIVLESNLVVLEPDSP